MGFIQTLSGKKFDYLNSTADDIVIEDIAMAQHSVLCSQIVPPEFALEALLHDGEEAYCCDLPTPLKVLVPDYRFIAARIDRLIRHKYNLPAEISQVVKYADLTMLKTERRDLDIDDGTLWPMLAGIPTSDLIQIIPLRPGQAYGLFMNRFNELEEARACA
mgnify:CR=1 FL=1